MNKQKTRLAVILTIALTFVINISMVTFAYFVQNSFRESWNEMEVDLIFGRLHSTMNPTGTWGSENNPYLISDPVHLVNLYTLQNRADKRLIDENSVFQVSTEYGKPVFIGGGTYNSLMNIQSIGTEEFPFVSKLRGVKATSTGDYITLPNSENGGLVYSDTSILGNIRVNATENQFDIGIFGNVGPKTKPAGNTTIGDISNLVLYNVEINATSVGTQASGSDHKRFVTSGTYETNHIGLLIGHAQYAKVSDISVYYSSTGNRDQHVKAFRVSGGTSAKYTTAQGVIGYYTDLIINEEQSMPLSSTGFIDQLGQSSMGLGLGVLYSEDVWSFMEKNVPPIGPRNGDEYGIKETFGAELYGANYPAQKAFNVGVFTFAHSKETKGDDRIEKIWPEEDGEKWEVSTTSNYNQAPYKISDAMKYTTKRITSADMQRGANGSQNADYHMIKDPTSGINYNSANNYRYMITMMIPDGTASNPNQVKEVAIVRYGASVILKDVDPSNFVILEDDLPYYTFTNLRDRSGDLNFPPFESASAYRYHTQGSMQFHSTAKTFKQFAAYGQDILDGSGPRYKEGIRPLRILYTSASTPSVTFNASSTTSVEGIHYRPYNPNGNGLINTASAPQANSNNANYYDTFLLRRTNNPTATATHIYMTYTQTDGLAAMETAAQPSNTRNDRLPANVAPVRIYAVRIAGGNDATPAPVKTDYNKIISEPISGTREIDMSENVLKYTGAKNATDPATRYTYDLQSLESLNWSDNNNKPISKVEKALTMGDATSYYYISGAANEFWGVAQELPSPIKPNETINVPEGSIGFTVSGTGKTGTSSKVFVIVASDPSLDVNQEITISRFGADGTSDQKKDRKEIDRFVLPPVPEKISQKTNPIYVKENGTGPVMEFYPNLNRLLVAYEFTVNSRYSITYFLEASQGIASFVYLSAERSAATDNNPTHENKVNFPHLTEIDYVIKGRVAARNRDELFTVTHASYSASLTSLYFGLKPNPANPTGENPNIDPVLVSIGTGLNFTYQIGRTYDISDSKHHLYITIQVEGYGTGTITKANLKIIMNNYQFEFAEWSYINTETFEYSFADVINMRINGYTITNWETDLN